VALLYVLREFFLIGFLTFLFCFVVRSAVRALMRRVSPRQENHRLDSLRTVTVFLGICLACYGLGRSFPEFRSWISRRLRRSKFAPTRWAIPTARRMAELRVSNGR
jgi:predicted PurR-regulated permease PerM